MLDIGWSELLLIGVVALVVIGPEDLPKLFHTLGRLTSRARSMAREFTSAMEDAARNSGIDDAAKTLRDVQSLTSKKSLGLDALDRAADLGAAPGGWTWVLVRQGLRVQAIDNGPLRQHVLDSGLVEHLRADGFAWQPRQPLDWMVCDMVEQPRRVAERMATWLREGWCRHTIFNLKLPMKKRWQETQLCLDLFAQQSEKPLTIRAKQLYHDREEITVFATAR